MKRFCLHSAIPSLILGSAGAVLILCNIPAKAWLILLGAALIGAAVYLCR